MDVAELTAAIKAELPAVMAGLARRFPGTPVVSGEVAQAASHWFDLDPATGPQSNDEVFAWLFSIACQRHVMALVADCRSEVRGRLQARYRRSQIALDDVLQTAYMKAHRAIESKPNAAGLPTNFEGACAWFGLIADRTALDAIKQGRRRQRLDGPLGDDVAANLAADDPPSSISIDPCVAALPAGERQVATLILTGMKPAAIAASLNRPVGWVYERIRTAKEQLRRCLANVLEG